MVFVEIDETNIKQFSSVLPLELIDGLGISIGAAEDEEVWGAISLSYNGEEYNVDWLYVSPSVRFQGIGRELIREVRSLVANAGLCPIRMQVNASDDSGLYGFLLSIEDEDPPIDVIYSHDRYIITTEDFSRSAIIEKVANEHMVTAYETERFWSLDTSAREDMFNLIVENFSVFDEAKFSASCEKDLCLATRTKGRPEAFILVEREDETTLKLSYLYAANPKALASLFQDVSAMLMEYPNPQTVYFEPITPESKRLADRIFRDVKKERIFEAEL